jgi:hypothetical protein
MPAFPQTAVVPEPAFEGALSAQCEAFRAGVCYVRLTSTPAVRGANNWGVIQFDEEGRVIPTWEDDDDGDAA